VTAAGRVALRRARDADRDAIWRVHTASIRALCAGWYGAREIEVWVARLTPAVYRAAILSRVMLVADREGEVVGFGQLDAGRREIEAIYVVPTLARHGVGSRLLRALEDVARRQGIGRLHLCASLNAETFYAAHGYRVVQRERHRLTDAASLDCLRMDKVLGP
jgi:GNAT superfamily N-acetyltransferase